jgi:Icc-related predicted phosphoesterase
LMRVVWLSDIHFNFLSPFSMEKLFSLVQRSQPDAVLISGDIGEAGRLEWYLDRMRSRFQCPIYFVLGNHDYYSSSFGYIHTLMAGLAGDSLRWLSAGGVVELTPQTALVGHDSWADGRLGDYACSDVMLNDYVLIQDFVGLNKVERLQKLNQLGDEAAAYCRKWLPQALDQYAHVFFLTHVPPFREACWHEGALSSDDYLPHFGSKVVGDALIDIMARYPQRKLSVLCGHTHSPANVQIRDNLQVLCAQAEYGFPQIQQIFELD